MRNWKFGLHVFVLFSPISTFRLQVSSRERLQNVIYLTIALKYQATDFFLAAIFMLLL